MKETLHRLLSGKPAKFAAATLGVVLVFGGYGIANSGRIPGFFIFSAPAPILVYFEMNRKNPEVDRFMAYHAAVSDGFESDEEPSRFHAAFAHVKVWHMAPPSDTALVDAAIAQAEKAKTATRVSAANRSLVDEAITGMISTLDVHSAYREHDPGSERLSELPRHELTDGLIVSRAGDGYLFRKVFHASPAWNAGLRDGDILLAVGTRRAEQTSWAAIRDEINLTGSQVELSLLRGGTPISRVLRRDLIEPDLSYDLNGTILHLRIRSFTLDAAAAARRILRDIADGPAISGILLDLRGNAGGNLMAAQEIADLFLAEGILVTIERQKEISRTTIETRDGDIAEAIPLVVLIDSGSGSASEVLAGALKDRKRAVLIGERSFGKGSVQIVIPLFEGKALYLTVGLSRRPGGRLIQDAGIVPDVAIDTGPAEKRFRESDLRGYFPVSQDEEQPERVIPAESCPDSSDPVLACARAQMDRMTAPANSASAEAGFLTE